MLARDQERMENLNYIYNFNNVEVVQMLWMQRAPSFEVVKKFREHGLLVDSMLTLVEKHVPMFLHVVDHN
jgi:hypothetical protein